MNRPRQRGATRVYFGEPGITLRKKCMEQNSGNPRSRRRLIPGVLAALAIIGILACWRMGGGSSWSVFDRVRMRWDETRRAWDQKRRTAEGERRGGWRD